jgi:pseudouridine synthase
VETTVKERLQKLIAQANAASSRRAAEALIEQRRVRVNGEIAKLGDSADPDVDVITVDGARLQFDGAKKIYIALNKPKGVLTTSAPHKGDDRRTVFDLVDIRENLFSIGRLDADSEGLVVLTNDGALTQKLTHPRFRHTKTYKVEVEGLPGMDVLDKWRNGVILDEDERTAPCFVELMDGDKKLSTLRIIMTEGKKRQIRRVGMKLGHRVRRLLRTHIGMLPLGELRPGEWRELSPADVRLLKTPSPDLRRVKRQPSVRKAAAGDPARPARPPRPARDADPERGDRPARRTRLVDDDESPRRERPARPARDGDSPRGEKPARPGKPARPARPARDGDSPRGEKPARPGKPARPARPARDGDSPRGEKPARPTSRPAQPPRRRTPKGRP